MAKKKASTKKKKAVATNKVPTREEGARKTLEDAFFRSAIGSNFIKREPYAFGQVGYDAGLKGYDETMNGDEARKIRDDVYKQKKQKADSLGIAGDVPRPSDYDTMLYAAQIVKENQALLPLGQLEEIVSGIAGPLEFEVPKELKNKSYEEVQREIVRKSFDADGKKTGYELSEQEKDIHQMFGVLRGAYEMGAAKKIFDKNYLFSFNAAGKEIADKYAPKPKKPQNN